MDRRQVVAHWIVGLHEHGAVVDDRTSGAVHRTQLQSEHVEVAGLPLDRGGDLTGIARRERRLHLEQAHGVLQALLGVVHGDRAALVLVGVEQRIGAPSACSTAAIFQARLCASCTPVLSPSPPVGGKRWAASPTRKTRPAR